MARHARRGPLAGRPSRSLLARRRTFRPWSAKAAPTSVYRPVTPAPAAPSRPRREPTIEELLAVIEAADEVIKARKPKVPETTLGRWQKALARALGSVEDDVVRQATRGIRRSIVDRWIERDVTPATWKRVESAIEAVLTDLYTEVGDEGWTATSDALRVAAHVSHREEYAEWAQQYVLRETTAIVGATQDAVKLATTLALNRGYSVDQLARGVPADGFSGLRGLFGDQRALTIARTETANAYNLGTIERYRATSLVDKVNVFDGPSCGWTTHSDPELANGKKVTLDEAAAHPISHPNCQRAFGARVSGAPADAAPGGQKVSPPKIGPQPTASASELRARATAAKRFSEASRSAGSVTADMNAIARRTNAIDGLTGERTKAPTGLAFRLKGDMSRTIDKIMEDLGNGDPWPKVGKVKDALRYTLAYERDAFYSSMQRAYDDLSSRGYSPVKWKDSMDPSRSPLNRDVNTAWVAPDGTRFELQFHTQETFVRKNIAGGADGSMRPSHAAYEELRTTPKSETGKVAALEAELRGIWEGVVEPPGGGWTGGIVDDLWE